MEFWGVEVKPGKPHKVVPEDEFLIHLSQAALGECKKDKNEPVMLFAKVGEQKIVLGTLSSDKFPQISFDVVFEKEFELSHNSKNASVHFCGYQTQVPGDDGDEYPSDSSEEEDIPLVNADNGKADAKVEIPKPAAANAKPKANVEAKKEEPKESDESGDDDDSDDDDEDDSSDSDGAEPMSDDDEDEDDDDEDDNESEDEETPKKVESAKKRPGDSAIKTPAESKKQKAATPQKTDGKKNVHTATPHPAKKSAANGNKQSPKSGGQFSCKPCDRSFNSDTALQSHSKAKHGGK